MSNQKIYIHEFIDIIGHARAKYMHHVSAYWAPTAARERGTLCYGVWGTIGCTGRWPEVVNIWEEDGWAATARGFATDGRHATLQDASLQAWWAQAAAFRRGGLDRLLIPAPWTRNVTELTRDGVRGEFYAHELVQVVPGKASTYLELTREVAVPAYARFRFELVGAFRTAMRNDSECLLIWAIPSHMAWAEFEAAQESEAGLLRWRKAQEGVAVDWVRTLLLDAPTSPLRLGRQPLESDRRPLDEIP